MLAGVHFINLVDFVMVMPMGPDFAGGLGIRMSDLGLVGGAYTAAATVVGLLGTVFLDRFERRAALTACIAGLGLSTAAGALATGMPSMLAARAAAGSFGGLAATLCFSIVTDLTHESRRGRAISVVASGYSLATIVGVPAGLELSRRGGWRAPFLVVGGVALVLAGAARAVLPAVRGHLETKEKPAPLKLDAGMLAAFAAFGFAIFGNFLIVPNLPAYLEFNLGFPRAHLGLLYLFGGAASLVTMRVAGIWADRKGSLPPVITGTVIVALCLFFGVYGSPPPLSPILFFTGFLSDNAARWVVINALTTRVPSPSTRARFLSAQTAFSHAVTAAASMGSTMFLTSDGAGRLSGMGRLTAATIGLGLMTPLAVAYLERVAPKRVAEPFAPLVS